MALTLKPRFFLIMVAVLFLGFLAFNYLGNSNKTVLGAEEENGYILQEQEEISNKFGTGGGNSYQPITISHEVKQGDTLYSIADQYHADPQTILDYPYNEVPDDLSLKVGQELIIPNGYINSEDAPPPPAIAVGTGQFMRPVNGVVTQYASWFHPGSIDIGISLGTPVRAADNGTVIKVERLTTGYGLHVIIAHGNALTSLYGHLSEVRVVEGQGVRKSEILGLSGSTGRSTGPHLHFEVRRNGNPVDPMTLF
jgi:murein DD-endopeptidase MepM/ murein hydrolase activator NlpD